MWDKASIFAAVRRFTAFAQAPCSVLKFSTASTTTDIYRDNTYSFDPGITVMCRPMIEPHDDDVQAFGLSRKTDAIFVFAADVLREKFPTRAEGEWIDTRDRVVFEGKTYKLWHADPTGRIEGEASVVVVAGDRENQQ